MIEEDDRAVDVFYNLRELIRHELFVICKQYGTYKIILSTWKLKKNYNYAYIKNIIHT